MTASENQGPGWQEVAPGVFSREVPMEDRQLDVEYVKELAESAKSACARNLILETITLHEAREARAKKKKKRG
jgi:hypothetical protein